jgi:hypothetical protein
MSLLFNSNIYSQIVFKSKKYGYSFYVPVGWRIKTQSVDPTVDALIVDDKGNSFVIIINEFSEKIPYKAKEVYSAMSDKQIEDQYTPILGQSKLLKRGAFQIDNKEFYYWHLLGDFKEGLKMYHKDFIYFLNNWTIAIDAATINSMTIEKAPYFAIMLNSLKFE